jgi:hypothetical protein
MPKSMAEVHAEGGHASHPRRRCPACASLLTNGQVRLRVIFARLAADESSGRVFCGYTDGRRWDSFACPQLPLDELCRVLDTLVAWGDEQGYEVIDDRQVRVRSASGDHVMSARLEATTDGDKWLFNCGGAWTFVEFLGEDEP